MNSPIVNFLSSFSISSLSNLALELSKSKSPSNLSGVCRLCGRPRPPLPPTDPPPRCPECVLAKRENKITLPERRAYYTKLSKKPTSWSSSTWRASIHLTMTMAMTATTTVVKLARFVLSSILSLEITSFIPAKHSAV